MLPAGDARLIQIVDAAVADAARRSGPHLKCAPGCTQCCIGVFPISQLDAARLRAGLADLDSAARNSADSERAAAVRARARASVARLTLGFPGDPRTGLLDPARSAAFEDFANDEPCPALDPATGLCDLYTARPLTCRTFGPPLSTRTPDQDGLGVCELCFHDATEEEIAACAVHLDVDPAYPALESDLTAAAEHAAGLSGETLVAFALTRS